MSLLQEKLKAPLLPLSVVARPRLNDHFGLNEHVRLLMVQAPSGYGKTTLLAERLPALEQEAAWLRLDQRDDQPARFLAYWQAALNSLLDEKAPLSPVAEEADCVEQLERWLGELPEQRLSCRLVVDEFEHLTHPDILAGLAHWLRHQPPWLTLTLASRSRPALGLASLRLRGELEEIDLSALAFDSEEAQTLCAEQLSFPPTRVSLERALRRSGGWVMALSWLVERTTTRAGFDALVDRLSGAHPDFVAWFDELLSSALPLEERELMLQLGVLERFSPELMARLLEGERLTQRLEAFEQAGLFIERPDPHAQWYRFQRLFGEYLRHRRHELSLATQRTLHRRASQAWLALNDPVMALRQAILAEAPEGVASLLTAEGPALLARGAYALLAKGFALLGEPRLTTSPELALLYGWVSHAQFQFEIIARVIGWIEAQLHAPEWQLLSAEFATLRAQLAINQGDAERAAPLAEQALAVPARYLASTPLSATAILSEARFVQGYLNESLQRVREVERQSRQHEDHQLLLWSFCHQSEVLVAQGRLQAAYDIQERAFAHLERAELEHLPVAEFLYRIRSQVLWEWHRLDEAEQAALKGIAVLDNQGERWTLQCHIQLAKVAQSRGDQAQCADHIRRLRKILAEGDYHIDWVANAHATLLAWWHSTHDMDAVERWRQEAPTPITEGATNHFSQCNVRNHARALTLLGRFDEACTLLEALEGHTQRLGLVTDANRNQLCLAAAAWNAGREEHAHQHMHQALSLASRTALVGSFLRLGKPLGELLNRLLYSGTLDALEQARAERLLALAGRQKDFGSARRLMLDETVIADIVARPDVPELIRTSPLTRREWQILGLIHAGLSNEQIAEQLSVAPTTIKTHIRSLYQKQNIRRRDEAIALAGQLLAHIQGE
ncbi:MULTISPECIES: HTH-type transcriptional regulator MalT [unclassified Halomonas]|uniref:HTH-type transcriptional regulator MalT n=1 Tax=unclassified Halomonas TaxID=2609666 RepID=UPI0007DA1741|nr:MULTISPECIES: HTH-type transcriptional regulator MalT [unclassified Halomonas]MBT2788416.1 HTH-type transcriptional regulator MalT [Halomonas sp. ISL-106]MBT2798007.1 HTH-type transcriptional regulator MalT [Halomonas sp. ISL-104]OAL60575.1 helix-turn-helix transcriptional regulator [Halomonas sp. ALS9]